MLPSPWRRLVPVSSGTSSSCSVVGVGVVPSPGVDGCQRMHQPPRARWWRDAAIVSLTASLLLLVLSSSRHASLPLTAACARNDVFTPNGGRRSDRGTPGHDDYNQLLGRLHCIQRSRPFPGRALFLAARSDRRLLGYDHQIHHNMNMISRNGLNGFYPTAAFSILFAHAATPMLGTVDASIPFPLTVASQMAYNADTDTLYIVAKNANEILAVDNTSYVPAPPLVVANWGWRIVAGSATGGYVVPPGGEWTPESVTFSNPLGIAPLSNWALQTTVASNHLQDAVRGSHSNGWAGVFIMDSGYSLIRFMNFLRGNNVTTVAGNLATGFSDGIGSNCTMAVPTYGTSAVVRQWVAAANRYFDFATVLWADRNGHCVRQGFLFNVTNTSMGSGLDTTLPQMVLNVTTFAGWCRTGSGVSGTGLVYRRDNMISSPLGVLVVSPIAHNSSAMIAFITDSYRVSLITPMWPPEARMLLPVILSGYQFFQTGTAMIKSITSLSATMELYLGTGTYDYVNISMSYLFQNQSIENTATTMTPFTSNIGYTRDVALMAHINRTSSEKSTVMVLSGSTPGKVLQYLCCFDSWYAAQVIAAQRVRTWSGSVSKSRESASQTKSASASKSRQSITITNTASKSTRSHSKTSTPIKPLRRRTQSPSISPSGPTAASGSTTGSNSVNASSYSATVSPDTPSVTVTSSRSDRSATFSRSHPSPSPSGSISTTHGAGGGGGVSSSSLSSSVSITAPSVTASPSGTSSRTLLKRHTNSHFTSTATSSSSKSRPHRHGQGSSYTETWTRRRRSSTDTPSLTLWYPVPAPALSPAVIASVATISSFSSAASGGGSVATALATMGLAQRCLITTGQESNEPLAFPSSLIPPWRLGEDDAGGGSGTNNGTTSSYPRLPYYRAAAVASLLAHLLVGSIGGAVAVILIVKFDFFEGNNGWYVDTLLRAPLTALMVVAGIALDGGVGGGAIAVGSRGAQECGYLICGLLGPCLTMILVGLSAWFRYHGSYHPMGLLEGTKRESVLSHRASVVGMLHRWVVGMGTWKGMKGLVRLQYAAFMKYRGPEEHSSAESGGLKSNPTGPRTGGGGGPNDTMASSSSSSLLSWRLRLSPFYFFVILLFSNILLSSVRASASSTSCTAPSAIAAVICTLMTAFLIVLRPMTSVVKNIVAICMSFYAMLNAWVLFVAAQQHSQELMGVALTMAGWQAVLSAVHIIVSLFSFFLAWWTGRSRPEAPRRVVWEDEEADVRGLEVNLLLLPVERGDPEPGAPPSHRTATEDEDEEDMTKHHRILPPAAPTAAQAPEAEAPTTPYNLLSALEEEEAEGLGVASPPPGDDDDDDDVTALSFSHVALGGGLLTTTAATVPQVSSLNALLEVDGEDAYLEAARPAMPLSALQWDRRGGNGNTPDADGGDEDLFLL